MSRGNFKNHYTFETSSNISKDKTGTKYMETQDNALSPAERYFDWAATSPQDSEILTSALEESLSDFANPSSTHSFGKKARATFEEARSLAARSLGVPADTVFFTSGGTESDHIPLLSMLNSPSHTGRIIISGIEHPALREQCANLKKLGYDVVTVNPDKNGFVTADAIIEKVTGNTLLVSVMAVNNETGCIQPFYEIADRLIENAAGKKKPHFHVDCVQAAGKIPLDLSHRGIDSAALSAHKISGPRGIGILYLAKEINPFLSGGGQEKGIRSGTENLFGAIAFSRCLEKYFLLDGAQKNDAAHKRLELQKELTSRLITRLKQLPKCKIVPEIRSGDGKASQESFSPWVLQVAFLGIPGNVMVRALDAKGFAISTGSACSAKKQSRPILAAMGADRDIQDSAVRLSFGPLTTEKGMDALFEAISSVVADFN